MTDSLNARQDDWSDEAIGMRIIAIRLRSGKSQEEFGASLSTSSDSISKWERGLSAPRHIYAIKISELFGVTTDFIYRGIVGTMPLNVVEDLRDFLIEAGQLSAEYSRVKEVRDRIKKELGRG